MRPNPLWMRAVGLLACVWLFGGAVAVGAPATQKTPERKSFTRVLILGNSITRHGPSARIGWLSNWGMAASAKEKDFSHLILRRLAKDTGAPPKAMIQNIATFERKYAAFDLAPKLKRWVAFRADLVVLAIGENVPKLKDDQAKARFRASVTKLLQGLKAAGAPKIVVRSCFWPNAAKDAALKQACADVDGTFVDISRLSADERNYARSERKFKHRGVAAHPGDRGMKAIAEAILGAIGKGGGTGTGRL